MRPSSTEHTCLDSPTRSVILSQVALEAKF